MDVLDACHMMVVVREVRHGKGEFGAYAASMGERGGVMVREVRHGKGAIFGAYAASMGERGGAMRVLRVFVKDAVRVPSIR